MGIDHRMRDEPDEVGVSYAHLDQDGVLTLRRVGPGGDRETERIGVMGSERDPQTTARRQWASRALRAAGWRPIGPQWYTTPEFAETRLVLRQNVD
jgi:hypothetical protein